MIYLGEYISDGTFYGFRDEEVITSFLNLYRVVKGTTYKDLPGLINGYMKNGYYETFPISVHKSDHTVRLQTVRGTIVYASDELVNSEL